MKEVKVRNNTPAYRQGSQTWSAMDYCGEQLANLSFLEAPSVVGELFDVSWTCQSECRVVETVPSRSKTRIVDKSEREFRSLVSRVHIVRTVRR